LGLSISRKLIGLMGGEISLSSQLGQGSTFSFKLRLAVPEGAHTSASKTIAVQHQTVLIVDDNPVACQLLGKMMRNMGWTVCTAAGAKQATELLELRSKAGEPAFSLAYVDWHMPDSDGWQTIATLKQLCQSLKMPLPGFVLMSANGRESLAQRTLDEQEQLQAFLVKPVTSAMLLMAGNPQNTDGATLRRSQRASKRQLSGMRILVVEDNAINQQVAEELLTFEGALVSIAANGRLGVNAVASAKKQFDAVLMDVQMPVMDGYAATQAIRQQLGLAGLPIIGLTANAMAGDREACIKSGMNEHIGKPFDMEQLVSMLIRLTGRMAAAAAPTLTSTVELDNPDIELGAALQRLGGMRNLYVRAAGALQVTLQGLHAQLHQHLSNDTMPQVCALLHTPKGNAATLGLTPLSQELERLEKLCKAQMPAQELALQTGPLERKIASAQTALTQAIALCSDGASPTTANQTNTSSDTSAATLLRMHTLVSEQLLPMLVASDLGALTVFSEHRSDFESFPQADADALETAMQDLDFAAAIAVCNRLLSES
jgi:CheY-like chemotaxis protein